MASQITETSSRCLQNHFDANTPIDSFSEQCQLVVQPIFEAKNGEKIHTSTQIGDHLYFLTSKGRFYQVDDEKTIFWEFSIKSKNRFFGKDCFRDLQFVDGSFYVYSEKQNTIHRFALNNDTLTLFEPNSVPYKIKKMRVVEDSIFILDGKLPKAGSDPYTNDTKIHRLESTTGHYIQTFHTPYGTTAFCFNQDMAGLIGHSGRFETYSYNPKGTTINWVSLDEDKKYKLTFLDDELRAIDYQQTTVIFQGKSSYYSIATNENGEKEARAKIYNENVYFCGTWGPCDIVGLKTTIEINHRKTGKTVASLPHELVLKTTDLSKERIKFFTDSSKNCLGLLVTSKSVRKLISAS